MNFKIIFVKIRFLKNLNTYISTNIGPRSSVELDLNNKDFSFQD
jgi:hypothetical protein